MLETAILVPAVLFAWAAWEITSDDRGSADAGWIEQRASSRNTR